MRQTPIHSWFVEQGATFEEAGLWKRASYLKQPGEDVKAAVARECLGTRERAGMMDASTLGKIEVVGPDAGEFLNRIYINSFAKLGVGRCRYGLMLNEAGFVMDDGVVARLAEDRFHVTTTTVGAAHVIAQMEDYPADRMAGPESLVHLDHRAMGDDRDQRAACARDAGAAGRGHRSFPPPALPHLSMREGHICGVPTRLARVSFTGELGFEVNVPTDYGRAIWEAIWAEGRKFDCVAYGLDVLLILRAEKGFIVVGQETDGTVTPDDLGLGKMIAQSKPDFVGKRSLGARRPQARGTQATWSGCCPTIPSSSSTRARRSSTEATPRIGSPALGHVTSSYFSPTLGRTFAMALVAGGRARIGGTALCDDDGRDGCRRASSSRFSTTRKASASMAEAVRRSPSSKASPCRATARRRPPPVRLRRASSCAAGPRSRPAPARPSARACRCSRCAARPPVRAFGFVARPGRMAADRRG